MDIKDQVDRIPEDERQGIAKELLRRGYGHHKSAKVIESDPDEKEDCLVLVKVVSGTHLVLGLRLSDPRKEFIEYLINTHSCPSNFVGEDTIDVVHFMHKDGDIILDEDPHGALVYVGHIKPEQCRDLEEQTDEYTEALMDCYCQRVGKWEYLNLPGLEVQ